MEVNRFRVVEDPRSSAGSGIRDGKIRIRDNYPGAATLGTGLPMRIRIQESQINADPCESGSGKLVDIALPGGVTTFKTAITLVTIRVPVTISMIISVADPCHFGVDPDPDPRIHAFD
jgi:hypothetical protein